MSETYLAAVRRLPSCISGRSPCIAHHLRCAGGRGVGMKSEDRWALPLTLDEHTACVDYTHGVRSREFEWFGEHGVNCLDLATGLWGAFPNEQRMLWILQGHRDIDDEEAGLSSRTMSTKSPAPSWVRLEVEIRLKLGRVERA